MTPLKLRLVQILGVATVVLCFHVTWDLIRPADRAERAPRTGATAERMPGLGEYERDDTTIASCETTSPIDVLCVRQAFANLAYDEGPKVALSRLRAAMSRDMRFENDCHGATHLIGSAVTARGDMTTSQALASGDSICASGYYHGILEHAFQGVPRTAIPELARGLCVDARRQGGLDHAEECLHGVGHGVMVISQYDLPSALETCEALEPQDVGFCTGGVFMENYTTLSTPRSSDWVRRNDPVYPCGIVDETHKLQCYLQMVGRLREGDAPWREVMSACTSIESSYVRQCFHSAGANAQSSVSSDIDGMLGICRVARAYAADCLAGAASAQTAFDHGADRAVALCGRLSPETSRDCFASIGRTLASFGGSPSVVEDGCRLAPVPGRQACSNGAATR
jgi:hypothetical protein